MRMKPVSGGLPPTFNSTIRRIRTASFSSTLAVTCDTRPSLPIATTRSYATRDAALPLSTRRPSYTRERPARLDPRRNLGQWRRPTDPWAQPESSTVNSRAESSAEAKDQPSSAEASDGYGCFADGYRQRRMQELRRFIEHDPYEALFGSGERRLRGRPELLHATPAASEMPGLRRSVHSGSEPQSDSTSGRYRGRDRSQIIDANVRWVSSRRTETSDSVIQEDHARVYDPISGRMIGSAQRTTSTSSSSPASKRAQQDVQASPVPQSAEKAGASSIKETLLKAAESPSITHHVYDAQLREDQLGNGEKSESAFSQLRALSERLDRLDRARKVIVQRKAKSSESSVEQLYNEERNFWKKQYSDESALGLEHEPELQELENEEKAFWERQMKKERELTADGEKAMQAPKSSANGQMGSAREAFARRQRDFNSRLQDPIMMSSPFKDAERNAKLTKAIEAWRKRSAELQPAKADALDSGATTVSLDNTPASKHPLEDAGSGCSKRSPIVKTQQREWENLSDRAEREAARKHTDKNMRPPATNEAWKDFKAGKPLRSISPFTKAKHDYESITHDKHAFLSIFRKEKPLKYMTQQEFFRHKVAITDVFRSRRQHNAPVVDEVLSREIEQQKRAMKSFEDKWHRREDKISDTRANVDESRHSRVSAACGSTPQIDASERTLVKDMKDIYESTYGPISITHVQGKLDQSLEQFERARVQNEPSDNVKDIVEVEGQLLDTALGDYDSLEKAFKMEKSSDQIPESLEESSAMDSALERFETDSIKQTSACDDAEPWKLESALERMNRATRASRQPTGSDVTHSQLESTATAEAVATKEDGDQLQQITKPPSSARVSSARSGSWGVNPILKQKQRGSREQRVNSIDGTTGQDFECHQPQVGNFASPTGFVNYDIPIKASESSETTENIQPRYVHREEEVFSGQVPAQKQSTAEIVHHFRENGFPRGEAQMLEKEVLHRASEAANSQFGSGNSSSSDASLEKPSEAGQTSDGPRKGSVFSAIAGLSAAILSLGVVAYAIGAGVESARLKAQARPSSLQQAAQAERPVKPVDRAFDAQRERLTQLHDELSWLTWGLRGVLLCFFPFLLVLFVGGRD